ncbi:hypothetical protein BH23PLA1_BH23PLA1_16520 [soil metagenome]
MTVTAVAIQTAPTRGALLTYTELLSVADRGDLESARRLCTQRYRQVQPLELAPEGGVIGLPRSIDKNFRAWRADGAVLLCPTGRTGPVYRFLQEDGRWRFDGPIGLLGPSGELREDFESGEASTR